MQLPEEILLEDYNYDLPEEKIAQQAAEPRDASKLLVYKSGQITDAHFRDLDQYLPNDAILFFNNARVIPARIFTQNSNGAKIEIFLLQPFESDYASALNATGFTRWTCLIGNSKKWKEGEELYFEVDGQKVKITRNISNVVSFEWENEKPFSSILEAVGKLPLPPYIHHEADDHDLERYQTVYSKVSGSVAAPTAGLHFTPEVLNRLRNKGIQMNEVTLHVSAGTFLPVKTENALEHDMHEEVFEVDEALLEKLKQTGTFTAVGTTACRVLESLHELACKIKSGEEFPCRIMQFDYKKRDFRLDRNEVAEIILKYMRDQGIKHLSGSTKIMIVPGYSYKMVDALITNFHQPKSTLLLLVSAFIGKNRDFVYQHALRSEYRFLSYGDSSLLIP